MTLTNEDARVVAQGAYGCVLYPPLRTTHAVEIDAAKIGKVLAPSDAAEEFAETAAFRAVDPEGRYGVYGERPQPVLLDPRASPQLERQLEIFARGGHVASAELARRASARTARALLHELHDRGGDGGASDVAVEVLLPRGLGDLETLLPASVSRGADLAARAAIAAAHLRAMAPLFDGVAHFHRHGLYHLDLKPENILGLPPSMGGGLLQGVPHAYKLIDFGLAQSDATAPRDVERPPVVLGTAYAWYPLIAQVYFQGGEDGGFLHDGRDMALDRVQGNVAAAAAYEERFAATRSVWPWVPYVPLLPADLPHLVARYGLPPHASAQQVRLALMKATDVYSLAAVLALVLHECLGVTLREGEASGRMLPVGPREAIALPLVQAIAAEVWMPLHLRMGAGELPAMHARILDAVDAPPTTPQAHPSPRRQPRGSRTRSASRRRRRSPRRLRAGARHDTDELRRTRL